MPSRLAANAKIAVRESQHLGDQLALGLPDMTSE